MTHACLTHLGDTAQQLQSQTWLTMIACHIESHQAGGDLGQEQVSLGGTAASLLKHLGMESTLAVTVVFVFNTIIMHVIADKNPRQLPYLQKNFMKN